MTGCMFFGAIQTTYAQDVAEQTFHQLLKQRFIEGGPSFMGVVLVALILGLAIAIERIIYLNMATTNTKKLVASVDDDNIPSKNWGKNLLVGNDVQVPIYVNKTGFFDPIFPRIISIALFAITSLTFMLV